MKNSLFLYRLIVGLIVFSLISPAVMPLLERLDDTSISLNLSDEDPQKEGKKEQKEGKKEFEEKDVFFEYIIDFSVLSKQLELAHIHYAETPSDFRSEIVLPPPEHSS